MKTLFERLSCISLAALLGMSLTGCEFLTGTSKTPIEPVAHIRQSPRLQAGDKVKVVVFGEDKLSTDYEVSSNGNISMPLIGAIHAAGLTGRELESSIAGKLRSGQILRSPQVTVNISTVRPFYVLGEVEKPGEYTFYSGLNVMSAAAKAGGYTYRASKSRVLIQRAGEKGFSEYPLSPDIPVFPGDLINVPERYF